MAHPHIITHLFTDGGRIVKSMRQSYAEILGEENVAKQVRERMKAQHTGMLEALKRGEFDALVWGNRAKPASAADPVAAAAPVSAPVVSVPAVDTPRQQPASVAVETPRAQRSAEAPAPPAARAAAAPARLPPPPRRSSHPPPSLRVKPPPTTNARKTMPRVDPTAMAEFHTPSPAPVAARARRTSAPPKRRTSHPPPVASAVRSREGLVTQTLDEVILQMLSEEAETRSG